jgi:hypothetical protein
MDSLDTLNERRAKIYEDIKRLISAALGPNVDLDEEAKTVINIWYESPDSNQENPKSPLEILLLEHDRVDSQIEPNRVDAELTLTATTARNIRQQLQALFASIQPSRWTRSAAIHHVLDDVLSTPEILDWLSHRRTPERARLDAAVRDWLNADEQEL